MLPLLLLEKRNLALKDIHFGQNFHTLASVLQGVTFGWNVSLFVRFSTNFILFFPWPNTPQPRKFTWIPYSKFLPINDWGFRIGTSCPLNDLENILPRKKFFFFFIFIDSFFSQIFFFLEKLPWGNSSEKKISKGFFNFFFLYILTICEVGTGQTDFVKKVKASKYCLFFS